MMYQKHTPQNSEEQTIYLQIPRPFVFNGQICWSNLQLDQMEAYSNKHSSKDERTQHSNWLQ
ncbi:MAG: hypothetical protein IBX48_08060 [Thiomicrospira sp.]|uniref:hypothetical protein n=1 Tax=Thiomicrospira sp. TaxID=935 RepID=UPI0019ED9811|nr:hypothetical protein [Thiomicrospira sp.]MBE0494284.1 hypothetical protein [Thiomicrospira sp.]